MLKKFLIHLILFRGFKRHHHIFSYSPFLSYRDCQSVLPRLSEFMEHFFGISLLPHGSFVSTRRTGLLHATRKAQQVSESAAQKASSPHPTF